MRKKIDEKEVVTRVSIQAQVFGKDALFLRTDAGKAADPETGDEFELSFTMAGTPIVRLPDGRWVTFSWPALIAAATYAGKGSDPRMKE